MKYTVTVRGQVFRVDVEDGRGRLEGETLEAVLEPIPESPLRRLVQPDRVEILTLTREADAWTVTVGGDVWQATVVDERTRLLQEMTHRPEASARVRRVSAPMPGLVVRLEVDVGEAVNAGQGVVVLEAMKMENELRAPSGGRVAAIHVVPGQAVEKGTPLVDVTSEG